MAHDHDPHMDSLFQGILTRNDISATGAMQIIQELAVSNPNDRKRIYELLREFLLSAATSRSKAYSFPPSMRGSRR